MASHAYYAGESLKMAFFQGLRLPSSFFLLPSFDKLMTTRALLPLTTLPSYSRYFQVCKGINHIINLGHSQLEYILSHLLPYATSPPAAINHYGDDRHHQHHCQT